VGATYQIDLWDGSQDGQQRRFHNIYAYHWRVLTLQAQAGTPAATAGAAVPMSAAPQPAPLTEGQPLPAVASHPGPSVPPVPAQLPPVPTPVPAVPVIEDDDEDVPF
jgi:hypothetical protein